MAGTSEGARRAWETRKRVSLGMSLHKGGGHPRNQAERSATKALGGELAHAKPNPKTLYRGGKVDADKYQSWSERKITAMLFGRTLHPEEMRPGEGTALKARDFVNPFQDFGEAEWLARRKKK